MARGVARNTHLRRFYVHFGWTDIINANADAVNSIVNAMLIENHSLKAIALGGFPDSFLSAALRATAREKGVMILKGRDVGEANWFREVRFFTELGQPRRSRLLL